MAQQKGTKNRAADQINSQVHRSENAEVKPSSRSRMCLVPHSYFSPTSDLPHSYRNASTGSSFEARMAGTKPLITPTMSNTAVERKTVIKEIFK